MYLGWLVLFDISFYKKVHLKPEIIPTEPGQVILVRDIQDG
jgi:hypothetical protein